MTMGMLVVLTIIGSTALYYTSANERSGRATSSSRPGLNR